MIEHNGTQYPTRELRVQLPEEEGGEIIDITISTETLQSQLNFDNEDDYALDETIYFYVVDDAIHLPAKEIAENWLDCKMTIVEDEV